MAKSVPDFVRVASTGDIAEGKMRKVIVGTQQILVVNVKGKYYAIGTVCPHLGGPLDRVILEGKEVQCRLPASLFDAPTGRGKGGPATRPEPVYDVRVEA